VDRFPALATPLTGNARVKTEITASKTLSYLSKGPWARDKTAQLTKSSDTSLKSPKRDPAPVNREPFPQLGSTEGTGHSSHITGSLTAAWPKTRTAQLFKGLEGQTPPSKPTPSKKKKPVEAFPVLSKSTCTNLPTVAPDAVQSAQFWGSLTKQTAEVPEKMTLDAATNREEKTSEIKSGKTGDRRGNKKWKRLQLQ
jgi:hypothetical protein